VAKNRLLHLGLAAIFMLALAALAALAQAQGPGPLAALGTSFTYQGSLIRDNKAYSGSCAMTFNLYDQSSGGTLKAGPLSNPTVTISNSVFTVPIDFGAGAFTGERRWLEIKVNCTGDGGDTTLPRQELTAAPYALSAASAGGLQGRPVSGGAPATGQALEWDGAAWSPGTVISAAHTHWGQTWTGSGTGLTLSGGTVGLSGAGTLTGVVGISSGYDGYGLYGENTDPGYGFGVYGKGKAYGVVGTASGASNATGGWFFGGMSGLVGTGGTTGVQGSGPTGVSGSGTTYGIYGTTTGSATPRYAGYFDGDVHIQGNFTVSGTKSAVVNTSQGVRALYAMESPESWFEDFGTATLADGRAVVAIDALFAETVNLQQNYHVFLTPRGDCRGLYVTALTPTSFEVRELGGGRAAVDFDYRIVAKRRGEETLRLEPAKGGTQ
jgi:hypothetical protein